MGQVPQLGELMILLYLLTPLLGVLGLFVAHRLYREILIWPAGEGKVAEIAEAIH